MYCRGSEWRNHALRNHARSEDSEGTLMRSALDARGDNKRCDDQCMDGVRNTSFAWIQTAVRMSVNECALRLSVRCHVPLWSACFVPVPPYHKQRV